MNAKECRAMFNTMIAKLAEQSMDPKLADKASLHITISMYQLQATWEIAAQLAEANAQMRGGKQAKMPDSVQ